MQCAPSRSAAAADLDRGFSVTRGCPRASTPRRIREAGRRRDLARQERGKRCACGSAWSLLRMALPRRARRSDARRLRGGQPLRARREWADPSRSEGADLAVLVVAWHLVRAPEHARRARRGLRVALVGGRLRVHLRRARDDAGNVFIVAPPKAEEMYSPETFGRGAGDRVVVGVRDGLSVEKARARRYLLVGRPRLR